MLYVASVSSAGAARGTGRGGPLGRSSPLMQAGSQAGTTAGAEHKAVSMGKTTGVELEAVLGCPLSLFILAGCGRSAAASRPSSSMRAAGVRGQAWPVAAAPDGSGRDNPPPQVCTVK